MPIPYQIIEAPIGPGLDEKTHPNKVELGKLIGGENFVFNKNGSLSKRFGSTVLNSNILGDASVLPHVELLSSRESELVALSNKNIFTYLHEYQRWINKDQVSECFGYTRQLVNNILGSGEPSIAYYDGPAVGTGGVFIVCYANTTEKGSFAVSFTADVYCVIFDAETYATILGPVKLNSASSILIQPRVCVVGDYAVVTYTRQADSTILARNINLTAPIAFGPETIIVNDLFTVLLGPGRGYDMQPITNSSTEFCLVYEHNGVVPKLRVSKYNAATLALTSTTLLASPHENIVAIAIHATQDETLWVSYVSGIIAGLWTIGLNTNTLAASVPLSLILPANSPFHLGIVRRTSTTVIVTCVTVDATGDSEILLSIVVNTAGAVLAVRYSNHATPASRPFMRNGEAYVFAYVIIDNISIFAFQCSLTLLSLRTFETGLVKTCRPVCLLSVRQSFIDNNEADLIARYIPSASNVVLDNQGNYHTMNIGGFVDDSSSKMYVEDAYVNFDTSSRMSAELGRLTYYTGGLPSFFDGQVYSEINFIHYPDIVKLTPQVGGSLTGGKTYSYVANYIYLDSKGNRHRSAPTVPKTLLLGMGQGSYKIDIKTINLTTKQEINNETNPIGIELWRTLADGTIFRKVIELVFDPGLLNNIIATIISYTDTASDVNISDNELLFTTGGLLDAWPVPSSQCMTVHKRRIWYGSNKTIWYSTTHVEDEAPIFNAELTFLIDEGGPITALSSMDDKLIIFKSDRIFILYGDGPTDAGTQSDFTDPQKISSNVGCISPKSVVLSPLGLFFQAKKGIYLLSRSLDIQYIGQFVENELSIYPNINSAILHPEDTEVRFIASQPNSGKSIELRFDFRVNQWSLSTYREPITGIQFNISSTCINNGKYAWATSNQISYENRANHLDNGHYVSMYLQFASLNVQGTQGYQSTAQTLLNCDRKSPHDMLIQLDMDNGLTIQNKTWSNAELAALPKEQLEVHPIKTKNQSLVVRMLDLAPAVAVPSLETGEGYSMIGLTYRVGQNDGPQKLPPEARK